MFLIVPSKEMLGNMKQSGEAPAPKEALTEPLFYLIGISATQ